MHHAVKRVGEHIDGATTRVLPEQMHDVAPKTGAPALLEYCT